MAAPSKVITYGAVAAALAFYILFAFFGGGGTAGYVVSPIMGIVARLPGRQAVRDALRSAAATYGLPPDWLDVIGWHESRWRLGAVGDAGRSFGPTQIQAATLAANGYDGDPAALTQDAGLAADWTARLMLAGAKNAEGVELGSTPTTLEDMIGWWNAGRQPGQTVPASTMAYAAEVATEIGGLPA